MKTRAMIEKALKIKSLSANSIQFERAGPDDWSWWTVTLSEDSAEKCRERLSEPEFSGVIEFCDIEEGMLQLSELPDCRVEVQP